MKSRVTQAVVSGAVLIATGFAGDGITGSLRRDLEAGDPAIAVSDLQDAMGSGITLALLGGFRAVAADFLWLETNVVWEEQDLPATQTLIRTVTAVDPRPLFFWINGARMIAYDMPVWRLDAAGGQDRVPAVVESRIREEQAAVALHLLDRALEYHPDNPLVLIEIASIRSRRLFDFAGAADYFRRAAGQPGCPYYAGRLCAEMLRKAGRDREAYEWLREFYPTLPADDPTAIPNLVLQRIRELEKFLSVPASERYVPPPRPKTRQRALHG